MASLAVRACTEDVFTVLQEFFIVRRELGGNMEKASRPEAHQRSPEEGLSGKNGANRYRISSSCLRWQRAIMGKHIQHNDGVYRRIHYIGFPVSLPMNLRQRGKPHSSRGHQNGLIAVWDQPVAFGVFHKLNSRYVEKILKFSQRF